MPKLNTDDEIARQLKAALGEQMFQLIVANVRLGEAFEHIRDLEAAAAKAEAKAKKTGE